MNISLLAFALMEYERRGWNMPPVHVRIYHWLESSEGARTRVLEVFRGCGKSTILGIRNAHKFLINHEHQILVQGADDDLAEDISRDTLAIMDANQLTRGLVAYPAGITKWWTTDGFAANARTAQMRAKGILSRTTGNRADEIQNDDVEVEKNVTDDKQRAKLRKKLGEQNHILKPGGSIIFVGTPHAHDSLYDEKIASGAEFLKIPMYSLQTRHEKDMHRETRLRIGGNAEGEMIVFAGIGSAARILVPDVDYQVEDGYVLLDRPQNCTIDICAGCAWPERFHRDEMLKRRKECRTFNEWDSQYQLQAKPVHECRLNPDLLNVYDAEPVFKEINKTLTCRLGNARIVFIKTRWDVASGQIDRDASVLTILLQDDEGNEYVQRQIRLLGELEEQCEGVKKAVKEFFLPHIEVESNGIGKFVPAILRKALAGTGCSVGEKSEKGNKHARILAGIEPVLSSNRLWVHQSVYDGPLIGQMEDFVPGTDGADDYPDSLAGAILASPVRIKRVNESSSGQPGLFRPNGKQYTAKAKFGV